MQLDRLQFRHIFYNELYMPVMCLDSKVLEDLQYIPVNIHTPGTTDLHNRIFGKAVQHFHEFFLVQETDIQCQLNGKMLYMPFCSFFDGKTCPVSMLH